MVRVISIEAARPEQGQNQDIDESGRALQAAFCFTCIKWFEGKCFGPATGGVIVTGAGLEEQIMSDCGIINGSVTL